MKFFELLEVLNVNKEEVLARFSHNEGLLKRFILKFPQEETFEALAQAHRNKQWEDEKQAVHTLKGIAANLGFETLALNCGTLLEDLRGEGKQAEEKFEVLTQEYYRLREGIEQYCAKDTK